jgi:hypothetical protein
MKSAFKSMLLGFVATTAFLGLASQLDAKVAVTQSPSAALVRGSSFAWAPITGQAYGYADPAIANEITGQRLRSRSALPSMAIARPGSAAPISLFPTGSSCSPAAKRS